MFVSTVIPTIGRSTLERAVESALSQGLTADEQEVIIVNDSGSPLTQAGWQRDPRVSVLNTQRRERGVARNVGAATAIGTYLHFLDDDDWLAAGALCALRDHPRGGDTAKWVYGDTQLFDREDRPLINLKHDLPANCFAPVLAGEWIPLQSSLFDAGTFFGLGGFDSLIPGAEDVDLTRRFALEVDAVRAPVTVGCIRMGVQGSSTNHVISRMDIRASREKVLDCGSAFGRMMASSRSAYLRGRVVRVYWTSALWNVRRRRLFTAASRMLFGLLAVVRSLVCALTPAFWRALFAHYRNETFERGFVDAGIPFAPDRNVH